MKWYEVILNYLTQESTYTGLLAIVTAFGIALKPELSQAIITFAFGTFGLIKVIVNEKAHK